MDETSQLTERRSIDGEVALLTCPDLDTTDWETAAADTIANILHLLDATGGNVRETLDRAERHYYAELVEDGEAPAHPGGVRDEAVVRLHGAAKRSLLPS